MKSHVSDYLRVVRAIYLDACTKCTAKVSNRDLLTIRSRVKTQGLSFLTITLPSFAADFEKSLAQGFIDSNCFRSFRKQRAIPAFLRDMLSHVFDSETGRIIDDVTTTPPIDRSAFVDSIRQICMSFKKTKLPCAPQRVHKAMENFVDIENSFKLFSLPREERVKFDRVCSLLWDNILGDLCPDMLVPRHGPGATAERISGNQKYRWQFWHERLEPFFPLIDSAYPISIGEFDYRSKELYSVTVHDSDNERPSRVAAVPKTLKGPRIIAIEPCCMQYAQQGLREVLYNLIESNSLLKGHINFRDQSVNQSLAMKSSFDCRLATIDLSDASDRVPRELALEMFRSVPWLRDAIDACRSTRAQLPDGRIISPLMKFASMGSALCFPVEAMYFYTICIVALLDFHSLPASISNINFVGKDVYVYGDDIIVPTDSAVSVLDHLRRYNCKVNDRKTFYSGKFRESCGVDAYNGKLVTPVYINTAPPKDRRQVKEILSYVSTANHFFRKGYIETSQLLFSMVEAILGHLPPSSDSSPILGRNHDWPSRLIKRWNKKYQRLEVKCWVPSQVYRTDRLDGYAALVKCLLGLIGRNGPYPEDVVWDIDGYKSVIVPIDEKHLERSALYGAVAIKRRWVPTTLVGFGQ